MEKRKKLVFLGVSVFLAVLFLALFFSGFFAKRMVIDYCEDNCPGFIPVESITFEQINIQTAALDGQEIRVPKNSFVVIRVENADSTVHQVQVLVKENGGFKLIADQLVGEKSQKNIYGFFNYPPDVKVEDEALIKGFVVTGAGKDSDFGKLPARSVFGEGPTEYLISCTTCEGAKSQVRVIIE